MLTTDEKIDRIFEVEIVHIPARQDDFDFLDWYNEKAKTNENFRHIKASLTKLLLSHDPNLTDPDSQFLPFYLFRGCWNAIKFIEEGDPDKEIRERYRAANEFAQDAAKMARKLRDIEFHPELGMNLGSAHLLLKEKGYTLRRLDKERGSLVDIWTAVFDSFSEGMDEAIWGHKCGAWRHRFRVGCLLYSGEGRGLGERKLPSAETILAFELIFHLRGYTSGVMRIIASGSPMPPDGKPCYDIVSDLVNLIRGSGTEIKTEATAESVRKNVANLLSDNPGIGLCSWPRERS